MLLAIASGQHTQSDIIRATGLDHITAYLSRLQELHFIRRHIPVTVPERRRLKSGKGRYDLADPYMRFYYRFIHPNQHLLEQGLYDWLWQLISEQLRDAFFGRSGFTGAAVTEAQNHQAILVDLEMLGRALEAGS